MICKVIAIKIYYTNYGGIRNSNSNILIFKVIIIVIIILHCIVIDPMSGRLKQSGCSVDNVIHMTVITSTFTMNDNQIPNL